MVTAPDVVTPPVVVTAPAVVVAPAMVVVVGVEDDNREEESWVVVLFELLSGTCV